MWPCGVRPQKINALDLTSLCLQIKINMGENYEKIKISFDRFIFYANISHIRWVGKK